jgi:hypothetical protein
MADHRSDGRRRVAAELLLVQRLPPTLRVAVPLVVCAACIVVGVEALAIQHHFAAQHSSGRLATLLARGSTGATAWEGWAAAVFFMIALARLRRGAPEPPAGLARVENLTARQLRAGLVREYTVVRAALVLLSVVALTDTTRAARYVVAAAGDDALARTSVLATIVEASGLAVATIVLALWAASFREQLDRMGALP